MIKYKHVTLDFRQWAVGFAWDEKGKFVIIGPVTIYLEI